MTFRTFHFFSFFFLSYCCRPPALHSTIIYRRNFLTLVVSTPLHLEMILSNFSCFSRRHAGHAGHAGPAVTSSTLAFSFSSPYLPNLDVEYLYLTPHKYPLAWPRKWQAIEAHVSLSPFCVFPSSPDFRPASLALFSLCRFVTPSSLLLLSQPPH
jgi:hypothetical protein